MACWDGRQSVRCKVGCEWGGETRLQHLIILGTRFTGLRDEGLRFAQPARQSIRLGTPEASPLL